MGLVTVDIGNTALKWARWESGEMSGPRRADGSDVAGAVSGILATLRDGDRVVVVSVVPRLLEALHDALRARSRTVDVVVTAELNLPFRLGYRTPATLGADRIAAVAGAVALSAARRVRTGPIIVVDAGTAITLEMLDASNVYLGGTIGPGPSLMRDALHRGTAQLPTVELQAPDRIAGGTTEEAIRSGLMHGFASMADGLVRRARMELGDDAWIAGTGGWATFLQDQTGMFDFIDPHLVLRGAEALGRLNGAG